MKLRVASYNILNTKDRYTEREFLLKQILYGLNADIVGLQEVVFGPDQLEELVNKKGERHEVTEGKDGYLFVEAPIQIEIFGAIGHPDKKARIDGNAILVAKDSLFKIERHAVLHISAVRNCQLVKLVSQTRTVWLMNTHLHHVIEDDLIRKHEVTQVLIWMQKQPDMKPEDCLIITGDFNAEPSSETYAVIKHFGFTSAHCHVHGTEPKITFPTGL